ncbi:MAG: hypothetical protein ABWJ98_05495 [Hydrogenothermaceae bacterium]
MLLSVADSTTEAMSATWSKCLCVSIIPFRSFGSLLNSNILIKLPGPGSTSIFLLFILSQSPPEYLSCLKTTVLPPAVPKKKM